MTNSQNVPADLHSAIRHADTTAKVLREHAKADYLLPETVAQVLAEAERLEAEAVEYRAELARRVSAMPKVTRGRIA